MKETLLDFLPSLSLLVDDITDSNLKLLVPMGTFVEVRTVAVVSEKKNPSSLTVGLIDAPKEIMKTNRGDIGRLYRKKKEENKLRQDFFFEAHTVVVAHICIIARETTWFMTMEERVVLLRDEGYVDILGLVSLNKFMDLACSIADIQFLRSQSGFALPKGRSVCSGCRKANV